MILGRDPPKDHPSLSWSYKTFKRGLGAVGRCLCSGRVITLESGGPNGYSSATVALELTMCPFAAPQRFFYEPHCALSRIHEKKKVWLSYFIVSLTPNQGWQLIRVALAHLVAPERGLPRGPEATAVPETADEAQCMFDETKNGSVTKHN